MSFNRHTTYKTVVQLLGWNVSKNKSYVTKAMHKSDFVHSQHTSQKNEYNQTIYNKRTENPLFRVTVSRSSSLVHSVKTEF